jgi:GST-like protein
MLKFYYSLAPNPMKIALCLEEMALDYEALPVDTRKGDQFDPGFAALNPNNKVPVIVDGTTTVFDSTAILIYLAEKTGQFLPTAEQRGPFLSWMMFVASGIGPYSGQAVHFRHFAPEPKEYALQRYAFEADRHWSILNAHLSDKRFMMGDDYTVLDMAVWGWARMVPFITGDDTAWARYPDIKRLLDTVSARPAAARAAALKDRYTFKTEMDDAARAIMFRHLNAA